MPRASAKTSSRTSASAAAHKRAGKATAHDALALLAEDHKKVKKMFKEFEKMKEDEDAGSDAWQMLVNSACTELTIHTQLEEEIFYPAMREAIDDMDLLDEALVEHASAKQLITELSSMRPDDELYAAKFTVLGEYVNHHIEEEEKELFPKAKKAKVDLMALGEQIEERKQELRDEYGLASEAEDESGEQPKAARSSKRKSMH